MMYRIEDFYNISFDVKTITLSPVISAIFAEIQSHINSSNIVATSTYGGGRNSDKYSNSHWERNKGGHSRGEKMHYSHSKRGSGLKKDIPAEDWETLRKFKTTKIEETVSGIDKDMNEIRISLNKISVNNYAIQKEAIVSKILQLQNQSQKTPTIQVGRFKELESWDDEEDIVPEIQPIVSAIDDANLVIVANAIFEIASSNKFFSDLYAELYKELSQLFPIFKQIASDFLEKYMESLPKISYIDPNIDYDGFCTYTKENDVKKATSAFIVNLMKKEVLSKTSILTIILQLYEVLLQHIHTPGKVNEVEELAENWGILISNAKDTDLKEDPAWQLQILPAIKGLSEMKVKEHESLSNRVIFKWLNILDSL